MNPETIAGVAHRPGADPVGVVVLTHGAGGDRDSALLVTVCEQWARQGWLAIRYNLPFRRRRASGPPPGSAAADQAGVAEAIALAAGWAGPDRPVIAGGHSYGGRLTSMAVAAGRGVAALSLFSYPLHPPGRPERVRTAHFADICVPTVFAHGSADPFGSLSELRAAARLIGAPTEIIEVAGARHDLRAHAADAARRVVEATLRLSAGG